MKRSVLLVILFCIIFGSFSYSQKKKTATKQKSAATVKDTSAIASKPVVTFIELGSVNCIPCKAMQKVMKAVEEKYGSQLKIIFYDVWKQEQEHYAQEYKIRLIPTQVFLDVNGKELMRHEGFFPEKDIDAFLMSKGLTPKPGDKG
ncbi:MAG: thioredoxin [Ignavibacteriae bacterium]|nr:MAG: thioredoxin [Ignavibacteriota bacterium]